MRWQVEECYKRIKQITHMEYFSGRTPESVEQDFHARIIMLNIAALIETQELSQRIERRTVIKSLKYKQQAKPIYMKC